jgi:hypothetical protein
VETHRRGAEGPVEAYRCAVSCGDRRDRRAGWSDGRRRNGPNDERGRRGAMFWNTARQCRNEGEVRLSKSKVDHQQRWSQLAYVISGQFLGGGCFGLSRSGTSRGRTQSPRRFAWMHVHDCMTAWSRRDATTADAPACSVSFPDLKEDLLYEYFSLPPLAHRSCWGSTRIYVRPH